MMASVRSIVCQGEALVVIELSLLPFPLDRERLDDLPDETGEDAFEVRRVLALDDVIANEGEVVTDENLAAEADADRESLVV